MLCKAVAPRLHGHLIRPEMGIGGQLRPLPGLEIQHIGAFRRAVVTEQIPGIGDGLGVEAESLVALLASRNGLEDQIRRGALLHRFHLGGHMGKHTGLGRNSPMLPDLLKAAEDLTEQEATLMDAIEEKLKKISDLRVEIATVQNKRYCPQCNTLLDAESNFCSHCGMDMNPACPEVQQAKQEAQEELEAFRNDGAVEEPAEENEPAQPAENAETTEEEEC